MKMARSGTEGEECGEILLGKRLAMTGFVGEANNLKFYSGFYGESAWKKCDILC